MQRKPKIAAHKTLWSVVRFASAGLGPAGLAVDGGTRISLHRSKSDADAAAAELKNAFVLPPKVAWRGTTDR
jgi:hypothetical protein